MTKIIPTEYVGSIKKMEVRNGVILHPELETEQDYICFLHEVGHLVQGLVNLEDWQVIPAECQAWAYVLTCTKSELKDKILNLALSALATYNWWYEATYGEWWTQKELLEEITKHERKLRGGENV